MSSASSRMHLTRAMTITSIFSLVIVCGAIDRMQKPKCGRRTFAHILHTVFFLFYKSTNLHATASAQFNFNEKIVYIYCHEFPLILINTVVPFCWILSRYHFPPSFLISIISVLYNFCFVRSSSALDGITLCSTRTTCTTLYKHKLVEWRWNSNE